MSEQTSGHSLIQGQIEIIKKASSEVDESQGLTSNAITHCILGEILNMLNVLIQRTNPPEVNDEITE